MVQDSLNTQEGKRVVKFDSIELVHHDLECLKDEVFINDQIIDFWLKFMKLNCLSEQDKARTYIFSSFFYTKLTNKTRNENLKLPAAEQRHARVASWTKKEDIFKYDFILVPITENAHWVLAIICFPTLDGVYDCGTGELISELKSKGSKARDSSSKLSTNSQEGSCSFIDGNDSQCGSSSQKYGSQNVPNLDLGETRKATSNERPGDGVLPNIRQPCILIFDSLASDMGDKICAALREYLSVEYKVKKGLEKEFTSYSMPGCLPRVPLQPNYYDCGVYLMQFAESFFSNPIKSFRPPLKTELQNWFHSSVTQKKRQKIYNSIVELVKKRNPENLPHIPQITFAEDSPTESQENMVLQNAAEDEVVDVSTDCESSIISTQNIQRQSLANSQLALAPTPVQAPTPNTTTVVLDHNCVTVSNLETPMPSSVKAESDKTVKNPPVPPSTTVVNIVTNPVIQPPQPHLSNCEPSTDKISLSAPALFIKSPTVDYSINTASSVPRKRLPCYANANSPVKKQRRRQPASSVPGKVLPCYANANAPVKRDNATKIFKVLSPSKKIVHLTKDSRVTVPEDAVVDKTSSPVILFDVPKTPTAHITQNINLSKIVGSQKAIIAKYPSTPELSSVGDTRPVRKRRDSWKVREMKSQGESHGKLKVEGKSSHSAQSSNNLSQHMMAPIANTMRDSVTKNVSVMNSPRKNDQRCVSPDIC